MSKAIRLIKSLATAINDKDIIVHAYQLTFSLLLAAFPFIIFLFTLLGYTQLDADLILSTVSQYLPEEIFKPVAAIIDDVVGKQRGGLLSLSILIAVWSSSAGFRSLMVSFDKAFGSRRTRPLWKQFLLSILWVILFTLFIIVAMLGMVFGNYIIDALTQYLNFPLIGEIGRLILTVGAPVAILFLLVLLMYRYIPTEKVSLRFAIPGALFTTLIWTSFTFFFRIYVTVFIDYSRFYGALGSIIGLLFWTLASSIIILVGAVIAGRKKKPSQI